MRPVAEWSQGARLTAVALCVAIAAGFVFWVLNLAPGAQDTVAAEPSVLSSTASSAVTRRAAQNSSTAPASSTSPTTRPSASASASAPSTSPAGQDGQAGSAPPLAFSAQDIDAAGQVAAAWIAGIASIDWQQDQQVRSDVLRAYLADPADTALTQWLAPSESTLTDLGQTRTVLVGTAQVTQVVTVARASILLQVQLTQSATRDGVADPSLTTADYIVTLVPRDGQWLVTAMIGAADGDPGT